MKIYLHRLLMVVFISAFSSSFIQSQNVLNFDGVNDYVNCSNILPQSYTKEAWIYITNLSSPNNIMSGDDNDKHVFWANPSLSNRLSSGHTQFNEVIDDNSLLANTWYHVAVTYQAPNPMDIPYQGTMKLYKNGVLVGTPNTTVVPLSNVTAKLYIGNFTTNNYVFAGNMHDVRIWSVVRSQSQIQATMNTSFTSLQTGIGLIANYTCNQGNAGNDNTGASLINVQGGGIGTLVNFELKGSTSNFISTAVLPVELLGFQATPLAGSSNLLTWQTANEVNNKGFQVERLKVSGSEWEILGFVAADGKHKDFEFTDNHPLSMSYYHLRQIDNDGKEALSKVVSVALKGVKGLKVYPTIVSNGFLNVQTLSPIENNEGSVYGIYNLLGQQVLKGQATQQIDVSALGAGTYVMKIGTEQAKFMKQ